MSLSDAAEQDYHQLIHKAQPTEHDDTLCVVCGVEIRRVPGGKGPTYIHADTGAVAAPGGQHYPISSPPEAEDDWYVCACGEDLMKQSICPHVQAAPCGCPEWSTGIEHIPGLCLNDELTGA